MATIRLTCGMGREMLMLELSEDIAIVVRQSRLRWYVMGRHVMMRYVMVEIRRVLNVKITDVIGRGRPRVIWKQQVEIDICQR